ncbi:MAG: DUF1552 domain-containing protein [Polyangiaceae bacterium]
MSRFALSRRTFLRGAAGLGVASVGLPMLDAMLNTNGTALAGGAPLPKQFVLWFMGNGVRLDRWEPTQTGATYTLSEELAPLANVQDYLKVITGLQNWCAYQVTHHEGMTAYSGYTMTELNGLFSKSGGPTIDQVIADRIEATATTPPLVRSIQCGVSRRWSIMDSGTTMQCLSHRGPNEALFPEFNPQKIWNTLFLDYQPKPDDSALRLSVLDAVREDTKKLQARLGTVDKQRLDAHLDGIRELEERIQALPPVCSPPDIPTETNPTGTSNEPLTSVNKAMSDLIVHAFKCDITRVASVFFIGGAAETVYTEIGQSGGHHMNTHNEPSNQPMVHAGVTYAMQQFAYLCEKMRSTVDPSGLSLLDTGLALMGSDCSIGRSHSVARQPYLLVGKGRDSFTGSYHYQKVARSGDEYSLAAAGNTSDVLYTVLRSFDPTAASVGDMTPRQLEGGWYGTNNPPNQAASGSSTVITELTGPAFG